MQPDPSSGGSPGIHRQEGYRIDPTPIREHLELDGSDSEPFTLNARAAKARAPVVAYREFTKAGCRRPGLRSI
jgi:hypothetical protein